MASLAQYTRKNVGGNEMAELNTLSENEHVKGTLMVDVRGLELNVFICIKGWSTIV